MKWTFICCMLLFSASFVAVGCSDEDGVTGGDTITLEQGTSTTQTIYADETDVNSGQGITFTTTGAWRAEVEEVAEENASATLRAATRAADWVTLSQTSGDAAGEYTITISIAVNDTGKDRKAVIRIICGDAVITITIEQSARTEEGELPGGEEPDTPAFTYTEQVASIVWADDNPDNDESMSWEFQYDTQGRITRFLLSEISGTDTYTYDYALAYSADGKQIEMTERTPEGDINYAYTLQLGENGYVSSYEVDDDEFRLSYDELDRLSEIAWNRKGDSDVYRLRYSYRESGNAIDSVNYYSGSGWNDRFSEDYDRDYTTYANKALSIDPNYLFISLCDRDLEPNEDAYDNRPGRLNRLALMRLVGRGADYYVYTGDDHSVSGIMFQPRREPGVILYETGYDYDYDWSDGYAYTFTGERINTISEWEKVTIKEYTYEVHVGTELLYPELEDPENPEYPVYGYKFEIKNQQCVSTTTDTVTDTYMFYYN